MRNATGDELGADWREESGDNVAVESFEAKSNELLLHTAREKRNLR